MGIPILFGNSNSKLGIPICFLEIQLKLGIPNFEFWKCFQFPIWKYFQFQIGNVCSPLPSPDRVKFGNITNFKLEMFPKSFWDNFQFIIFQNISSVKNPFIALSSLEFARLKRFVTNEIICPCWCYKSENYNFDMCKLALKLSNQIKKSKNYWLLGQSQFKEGV